MSGGASAAEDMPLTVVNPCVENTPSKLQPEPLRDRIGSASRPQVVIQHSTQSYAFVDEHFRAKDERDVPIEVSVSVNIRKLISIDVERQTFRAEVWIRSSWVDDSLDELWQKNERVYFADPNFADTMETNAWSPRIKVVNVNGAFEHLEHWFIPRSGTPAREYFGVTSGNGADRSTEQYQKYRVNHIMQVTGEFLMSMNLVAFPLDEFYLSIRLKACVPATAPATHCLRNTNSADAKRGLKLARLKVFHDPSAASRANKFSIDQGFFCHWSWWADSQLYLQMRPSDPEDSMGGATYHELGAYAHVVRDPWPMFYNVMCIHGFICTASLAVFLYDDPIDRVEPLFTIVTAAVAHKFVAVQNLPHLPYTTKLDEYIFGGLYVIFSTIAETAYEVKGGPGGEDVKNVFFFFLVAVWGLYNIWIILCFVAWSNFGREVQRRPKCRCGRYDETPNDGAIHPPYTSQVTPWFRWFQTSTACGCTSAYPMMREAYSMATPQAQQQNETGI